MTPDLRIVDDPAMRELHRLAERIARSPLNVLLLGETGVGKEVFAERIHAASPRAGGPFLRINCGALAEPLLESELFGHERGAFTGAAETKVGLLEAADGGTVLLDELGDMPASLQVKLLRVLEERQVRKVGSLRSVPIDVRYVAATHRDLDREMEAGRFRADLYFRLNGFALQIPPLRERRAELEPLARAFAERAARAAGLPPPVLAPDAMALLHRHRWPGNIRELRNVMERAVLLADDGTVTAAHLPLWAPPPPAVQAGEKEAILAALARSTWNQKRAAELLGISRQTLVARMVKHGIPRPRKQVNA